MLNSAYRIVTDLCLVGNGNLPPAFCRVAELLRGCMARERVPCTLDRILAAPSYVHITDRHYFQIHLHYEICIKFTFKFYQIMYRETDNLKQPVTNTSQTFLPQSEIIFPPINNFYLFVIY